MRYCLPICVVRFSHLWTVPRQIWLWKNLTTSWDSVRPLVNCPTRWSLLFIFGFLYWSSSWRLGPQMGVCRLLWSLLRAEMAVLTHFFLQNVFSIYKTRAQKKFDNILGGFTPPKKGFFRSLGPARVFQKLRCTQGYRLKSFSKIVVQPDLHTPIGGSHPMLYFTSQITKKYSIVLY